MEKETLNLKEQSAYESSFLPNLEDGMTVQDENSGERLLFGLEEKPGWITTISLAFQQNLLAVTGIAGFALIVGPSMCMFDDDVGLKAKAVFASSLLFVSGFITLIQCSLGTRLPIMQGITYTLIAPVLAVLSLPHNQCPTSPINKSEDGILYYNDTDGTIVDGTELWQRRVREIQGSMALVSILEVVIGLSGATVVLTRFLGPLTIGPSLILIGTSLLPIAYNQASMHWGLAIFTMTIMTVMSQYLKNVAVPIPVPKVERKSCSLARFRMFSMFPVLFSMVFGFILCWVLTATDVLPKNPEDTGYAARTDVKSSVIFSSPWFFFPYPGQWGSPSVSVAGIAGMTAAVIAGIVESIGDYYACAEVVQAPSPPDHAVARGITVEGIGCVIGAIFSCGGTTSYSPNVAAITLTKVASRRVMQTAGVIMMLLGMICKFGAVFVTIPTPVIGGLFCTVFGMIISIGISILQHADMTSPRNQYIVGLALVMGMALPSWIRENPGSIRTSSISMNQTISVLLETSIFVGGCIAAFLDNTIPGTPEERGLVSWRKQRNPGNKSYKSGLTSKCYHLPFNTNFRCLARLPIFPKYESPTKKRKPIEEEHSL